MPSDKLKEVLEQNIRMHDAHAHRFDNLWRAIGLLFLLQVVTIMWACIALGVN